MFADKFIGTGFASCAVCPDPAEECGISAADGYEVSGTNFPKGFSLVRVRANRGKTLFYLLVQGGSACGSIQILAPAPEGKAHTGIFLSEEFRGQGLGAQFVAEAFWDAFWGNNEAEFEFAPAHAYTDAGLACCKKAAVILEKWGAE